MKRMIVAVFFAVFLLAGVLVLTSQAVPECTCLAARAVENQSGSHTYTVYITATGASWSRIMSGTQVITGPAASLTLYNVTLPRNVTVQAQVATCRTCQYTMQGCHISGPTAITLSSFSLGQDVQIDPLGCLIMALLIGGLAFYSWLVVRKRKAGKS